MIDGNDILSKISSLNRTQKEYLYSNFNKIALLVKEEPDDNLPENNNTEQPAAEQPTIDVNPFLEELKSAIINEFNINRADVNASKSEEDFFIESFNKKVNETSSKDPAGYDLIKDEIENWANEILDQNKLSEIATVSQPIEKKETPQGVMDVKKFLGSAATADINDLPKEYFSTDENGDTSVSLSDLFVVPVTKDKSGRYKFAIDTHILSGLLDTFEQAKTSQLGEDKFQTIFQDYYKRIYNDYIRDDTRNNARNYFNYQKSIGRNPEQIIDDERVVKSIQNYLFYTNLTSDLMGTYYKWDLIQNVNPAVFDLIISKAEEKLDLMSQESAHDNIVNLMKDRQYKNILESFNEQDYAEIFLKIRQSTDPNIIEKTDEDLKKYVFEVFETLTPEFMACLIRNMKYTKLYSEQSDIIQSDRSIQQNALNKKIYCLTCSQFRRGGGLSDSFLQTTSTGIDQFWESDSDRDGAMSFIDSKDTEFHDIHIDEIGRQILKDKSQEIEKLDKKCVRDANGVRQCQPVPNLHYQRTDPTKPPEYSTVSVEGEPLGIMNKNKEIQEIKIPEDNLNNLNKAVTFLSDENLHQINPRMSEPFKRTIINENGEEETAFEGSIEDLFGKIDKSQFTKDQILSLIKTYITTFADLYPHCWSQNTASAENSVSGYSEKELISILDETAKDLYPIVINSILNSDPESQESLDTVILKAEKYLSQLRVPFALTGAFSQAEGIFDSLLPSSDYVAPILRDYYINGVNTEMPNTFDKIIDPTNFSGMRITARQNALYEEAVQMMLLTSCFSNDPSSKEFYIQDLIKNHLSLDADKASEAIKNGDNSEIWGRLIKEGTILSTDFRSIKSKLDKVKNPNEKKELLIEEFSRLIDSQKEGDFTVRRLMGAFANEEELQFMVDQLLSSMKIYPPVSKIGQHIPVPSSTKGKADPYGAYEISAKALKPWEMTDSLNEMLSYLFLEKAKEINLANELISLNIPENEVTPELIKPIYDKIIALMQPKVATYFQNPGTESLRHYTSEALKSLKASITAELGISKETLSKIIECPSVKSVMDDIWYYNNFIEASLNIQESGKEFNYDQMVDSITKKNRSRWGLPVPSTKEDLIKEKTIVEVGLLTDMEKILFQHPSLVSKIGKDQVEMLSKFLNNAIVGDEVQKIDGKFFAPLKKLLSNEDQSITQNIINLLESRMKDTSSPILKDLLDWFRMDDKWGSMDDTIAIVAGKVDPNTDWRRKSNGVYDSCLKQIARPEVDKVLDEEGEYPKDLNSILDPNDQTKNMGVLNRIANELFFCPDKECTKLGRPSPVANIEFKNGEYYFSCSRHDDQHEAFPLNKEKTIFKSGKAKDITYSQLRDNKIAKILYDIKMTEITQSKNTKDYVLFNLIQLCPSAIQEKLLGLGAKELSIISNDPRAIAQIALLANVWLANPLNTQKTKHDFQLTKSQMVELRSLQMQGKFQDANQFASPRNTKTGLKKWLTPPVLMGHFQYLPSFSNLLKSIGHQGPKWVKNRPSPMPEEYLNNQHAENNSMKKYASQYSPIQSIEEYAKIIPFKTVITDQDKQILKEYSEKAPLTSYQGRSNWYKKAFENPVPPVVAPQENNWYKEINNGIPQSKFSHVLVYDKAAPHILARNAMIIQTNQQYAKMTSPNFKIYNFNDSPFLGDILKVYEFKKQNPIFEVEPVTTVQAEIYKKAGLL